MRQPSSSLLSLRARFDALGALLFQTQDLWKIQSFKLRDLDHIAWRAAYPELFDFLLRLSLDQVYALTEQPEALVRTLSPYVPEAARLHALCALEMLPAADLPAPSIAQSTLIPQRKLAQVTAFARRVAPSQAPFLDWCAGKGHLARMLALSWQKPVTCLEREASLCEAGRRLATRFAVPLSFHAVDVMQSAPLPFLKDATHHATALHACGGLHRRLLVQGSLHKLPALSIAPCCYFLFETERYVPFSHVAKDGPLHLVKDNLRLTAQEHVTGKAKRNALRIRISQWRLAFDELQRDLRGSDTYINVPSVTRRVAMLPFVEFCHHLAQSVDLQIPDDIDVTSYQARGIARYQKASPLELIRLLFLRPLEVWLVLDRALFLQEQGYEVSVGLFCEKEMTPRNLMLRASLS